MAGLGVGPLQGIAQSAIDMHACGKVDAAVKEAIELAVAVAISKNNEQLAKDFKK